jgi:sialate O-acetylesterase
MRKIFVVTILIVISFCSWQTYAGVNVVGLFRDNMVLQRDMELPVWGGGKKGDKVTVEFVGVSKTAEVDETGKWMLKLGSFPAGGPHEMKITQGADSTTFKNILMGEVWICSGQSNMQWDLKTLKKNNAPDADNEIANAKYPDIRFITVVGTAGGRQQVIPCGSLQWRECSPETAGDLSAVAYFFAKELRQKLNVPIGLIVTAQGSSPIRSWISAETMNANPIFKVTLEEYKTLPERKKAYDEKRATYEAALAKSKADGTNPPPGPGSFETDASPGPYFYGRVYPLAPFAMRGVIWYQGESDAMYFQGITHAKTYKDFFPVMISEWRSLWGYDFPFLYVQLAPGGGLQKDPVESSWAELRDAQRQSLKVKNTAMVVTTDICDADLHPRKKVDVGKRLALSARAVAYGESLVYSGPIFNKAEFKDGKVTISFTHIGGGLMARGGQLKGFSIAGTDRKFVWADSEIKGDTVVVSSGQVTDPKAVRYAWAENPIGNLFNKDGFPASCFRTDEW